MMYPAGSLEREDGCLGKLRKHYLDGGELRRRATDQWHAPLRMLSQIRRIPKPIAATKLIAIALARITSHAECLNTVQSLWSSSGENWLWGYGIGSNLQHRISSAVGRKTSIG